MQFAGPRKYAVLASGVAIVAALAVGSTPATAASVGTESDDIIAFGYWDTSSFEEVYESVTADNEPEAAAALFAEGISDPSLVPALDALSDGDRETVLREAASAASADEPLPANAVTLSGGLGTPILGQPIANGFSWQHKDRYNWTVCEGGTCETNDWMDFTYTIDPGGSGTRVTVNTLTWGTKLDAHRVDGDVYRDAELIRHQNGPTRSGDGTYTIWLTPHLTLTGYNFAAVITTQVWGPGGSSPQYAFRTGPTSDCTEPTPGAWRCIFLD